MSSRVGPSLSLSDATALLKPFDCPSAAEGTSAPPLPPAYDREAVRQALLTVAQHSDYQILGICADTIAQGLAALQSYATLLGYTPSMDIAPMEGPVYIKFNPKSGLCYVDSYNGHHRGVLVSCQSAYDSGLNAMFGHLPLDLLE
ncbi:MAG TPA: DUF1824 family protein [Chroococcidiopsis sp.]